MAKILIFKKYKILNSQEIRNRRILSFNIALNFAKRF